jgi:hypothetical protein
LAEQLALAMTPRPRTAEQARRAEIEEIVRRILVEELPAAVMYLLEEKGDHAA